MSALAAAKAGAVLPALSALDESVTVDCVVIGCDSLLELDGRACGVPGLYRLLTRHGDARMRTQFHGKPLEMDGVAE